MSEQYKTSPETEAMLQAMREWAATPEGIRQQIYSMYRFVLIHWADLAHDSPVDWDQERALDSIHGSAISDDPPDGWGKSRVAQFARGWSYGEANFAGNMREYIEMLMRNAGMKADIAPAPYEGEPGQRVEIVRKWLREHVYSGDVDAATSNQAPARERVG